MPTFSRAFLIALAVAFVVVVFCLGTSFTYSAESTEGAQGSEFFWLLLAVVFASPLWVPAALPTRSRWVSATVRWVSAAALLVPLRYAGAVVLHQAQLYPHSLFSASIFTVASTLSVGCAAAIVVLLLPSPHRVARQAA